MATKQFINHQPLTINHSVVDHLNVAFVGHVDHGKSTLIGRLLYDTGSLPEEKMREIRKISRKLGRETEFAYVMDHLSEEREQMMTIDTAQTFFHTAKREYVIIDAPGHKELLKNMITGACQADAAVLLLDVHEGIMEQTKRHAFILGLLGLKQSVIAINKMDLVQYDQRAFVRMRETLLIFLKLLKIEPVAVIPVAAKAGENVVRRSSRMDWYHGPTLCEVLDQLAPIACQERPLRLSIQDVYSWVEGGIAAGRVEAGLLAADDRVIIEPVGRETTVRKIRKFMDEARRAETGECIGIAVADDINLKRGQVLCDPKNRPIVANKFSANIFWLDPISFSLGESLTLRLATQDVQCQIQKIEERIDSSSLDVIETNANELRETEVGQVIMTTESPVVLEAFSYLPELGRFVLERGMRVVAGGTVIGS